MPQGVAGDRAGCLGIVAAINVLWGAGASMVQHDMKKMIAYSSVSHMGYVLLGVAAAAASVGGASLLDFRQAALTGATLQMFTHGTITGMLFFCVGVLYDKAHTREIDIFGGIATRMPHLITLYSIACFASLGLPGAGWLRRGVPGLHGDVRTAARADGLRRLRRGADGGLLAVDAAPLLLRSAQSQMAWADRRQLREAFPLAALAVVILFVGIYPQPLVDLITPAMQQTLHTVVQALAVH